MLTSPSSSGSTCVLVCLRALATRVVHSSQGLTFPIALPLADCLAGCRGLHCWRPGPGAALVRTQFPPLRNEGAGPATSGTPPKWEHLQDTQALCGPCPLGRRWGRQGCEPVKRVVKKILKYNIQKSTQVLSVRMHKK